MQTRYGHRYHTYIMESLVDDILAAVKELPDSDFDELTNPFESKLVVRDKFNLSLVLEAAIRRLENMVSAASTMFDIPSLEIDHTRHYAGVFRYPTSGYLSAHVDAGIHPISRKRKHITVLLYLAGSGDLELWQGENCTLLDPQLFQRVESIAPDKGRVIIFENNDFAWHSAAPNTSDSDRIVLTVSFISNEVNAFLNKRERAFFAPRPTEKWTDEQYELRNKRASTTEYADAYRVKM